VGMYDRFLLETSVHTACVWEVTARKLGNVHRYADFDGTAYLDFVLSAGAITSVMGNAPSWGNSIGQVIGAAARSTREVVGTNTNIGIILLLAPLASTWVETDNPDGRRELDRKLRSLTVQDARDVYEAIRLANPGGLGDAPEQDVRSEPTVTLLEAMKLAADRDLIARQYATGYSDVFDFGVPAFLEGLERYGRVEAAIIHSQLRWLADFPDSLIARKNGPAVAEDVRRRSAEVLRLGGIATPEGRAAGVTLDRYLRSNGNRLNPGTTADLIAACLFVALRENKVAPSHPFRWDTPDWL
jgi:triphosphoribosyl-dephospho-CoA synthase